MHLSYKSRTNNRYHEVPIKVLAISINSSDTTELPLINPLAGNIVAGHMKAAAQQAHLFLSQLETILVNHNVDFRLIYGEASRKGFIRALLRNAHKDTDYQFEASVGATLMGGATYVIGRTDRTLGDGTVPVNSAALNNPADPQTRFGVVGVGHANMCNDKHVVNLVKQWLP